MEFVSLALRESITIQKLYSFHYFECTKGYLFEGEQHDFWEFLYVDKGEVEVRADDRTIQLSQGMIIFHKPNEFHTVRVAPQHKPPNLFVICFGCKSPYMSRFENKIIVLGKKERELLALILQEGFQTFTPPFDDPFYHVLTLQPNAPLAGKQVIKSHLETLLIYLLRNEATSSGVGGSSSGPNHSGLGPGPNSGRNVTKITSMQNDQAEYALEQKVVAYMKEHLSDNLTLDRLCQAVHIGKSRLKEIFQSQTGTGAMEYFKRLKIQEAKSLIREKQYNMTEISSKLGYKSIHYFSRDFKKVTGMSPTDYARSLKARAEG